MSGNRGCLFNSFLFLVIIFIPGLGHIIDTILVFQDDHSTLGRIGWLLVIWLLFPVVGPLLYLLFGQRRSRVYFGRGSGGGPSEQPLYQ